MNIRTAINPFCLVYKSADSTSANFPIVSPTNILPVSEGVIKITPNTNFGQTADNNIRFVFFGQGSDNTTFQAQIVFWTKIMALNGQYDPSVDLWIPEIVYNVDGTLSGAMGVDGTSVDSTHRFADTLAVTAGTSNAANSYLVSPTGNNPASLTVPLVGPQLVQVLFKMGSATAMNAISKTF